MKHFATPLAAAIGSLFLLAQNAGAQTTIGTTYYDDHAALSCSSNFACVLTFRQLPTDKFILFTNVSCYIQTNQPVRIGAIGIADSAGAYFNRSQIVPFIETGVNGATHFYNINAPIRFLGGKGKVVKLDWEFIAAANSTVDCTIVGMPMTTY
jgi:hypothetical protein